MSTSPEQEIGAYAEFPENHHARRAVQALESRGVPRNHILISGHAPDQSSAPLDTESRDKGTIGSMWRLGTRGLVLGFLGGAVFGALLGALVWTPMTAAWMLLSIGLAVFGAGLGLMWSFLIGQGEGEHMGTVYDEPAADAPIAITVRADDPKQIDELLKTLEEAGGQNLGRVPEGADRPRR